MLKICHGSIEIAGQMGILSGALKQQGHISVGYNIFHSYLGYERHIINTTVEELQNTYKYIVSFYDLFHFHYASSLLPDYADLEVISKKGKPMIMHHWGNDVRFHEQAKSKNAYAYTGDSPPDPVIDKRLRQMTTYIKEAIVQDEEVRAYVQPYYEKVHVVPIAIDLRRFPPVYVSVEKKKPLIIHAPTNPAFKGTSSIEQAIGQLKEAFDFEYRRIEHMNHEQAATLYRQADIVVDQVLCGSYGLFSVEAMALGKPVLAFIRPDLVARFPAELPIVNTHPEMVSDNLQLLLEQPQLRYELGVRGRAYVEKYHDCQRVVRQLLEIYASLGER